MTRANSGIPLDEWSGAGATKQLHETIKQFNEASSRQTQQIITLTKVLVWLTVVMAVGLVVQIVLALKQLGWI
jgi:hypothetical protein